MCQYCVVRKAMEIISINGGRSAYVWTKWVCPQIADPFNFNRRNTSDDGVIRFANLLREMTQNTTDW